MNKEIIDNIFENKSLELFQYEKFFSLFKTMYHENILPKKILLSGLSGLGKTTFALHFINYVFSINEKTNYDEKNFKINILSNACQLISQNIHPNFYYIKTLNEKKNINIEQSRNLISFLNKTSLNKNKRFVMIDGAEDLNDSSANSLLKTLEEPSENVFFIFIYDSSKNIKNTIKSRCTEFKISFSKKEKEIILNKILEIQDLKLDIDLINEIKSYYDSPGLLLSYIELFKNLKLDNDSYDLKEILKEIFNLSNNENKKINYETVQYLIELFFHRKLLNSENKGRIYFYYSKTVKLLDDCKKFNLDFDNISHQIEKNILYA